MKIAVVGAGIIGLSAARCIQQENSEVEVIIVADVVDLSTTSDGAAGLFHPDQVDTDHPEDLKQWIQDSAEHYWKHCYSEHAPAMGIFEISGYTVTKFDKAAVEDSVFHQHVRNFRRIEGADLDKVGGGPWRYGSFKSTLITEPRIMMNYLLGAFQKANGTIRQQKVGSLQDLAAEFDVVVNCAGLMAGALVNDDAVFPIRGQVTRVNAPWIKHFYHTDDNTYIIPNRDLVVVGGTRQKDNWSLDFSVEDREAYMQRASAYLPSIRKAEIIREWVGLRPGRPFVRLETEMLQLPGDKVLPLVHNYGHGGNGIALSWGCGRHTARLVRELLEDMKAKPKTIK
ncbi:hypothetical protein RvY_07844 [Ramazzottius varieornatus]|uniref:FAD dependent oxidoreductase domain-containing protein n=1 Tax=Ramazzottius varieornatus TaxID=947166 RepID=A0A1D1V3M6_RAMVA|nr:hypothetical protein RvY_07844 [Ramazzottius varieornatus]